MISSRLWSSFVSRRMSRVGCAMVVFLRGSGSFQYRWSTVAHLKATGWKAENSHLERWQWNTECKHEELSLVVSGPQR